MSKRDQEKEKTRKHILSESKLLFMKKGLLKTSTKELALQAGIAHGTLFYHFKTKELLMLEIIDRELGGLTGELHSILHEAASMEELLKEYLGFLEKEEDFFAAIAREFPFYSENLRRQINFRQGSVRGYFIVILEKGIKEGIYKKVEPTGTLGFFFSTLDYLLARRETITGKKSVIKENKDQLIRNFLLLLKR